MSNLYVVGMNTDTHPYVKVGKTTRCVLKRIGDWETGCPFQFVVLANVQVPKGTEDELELLVHEYLKEHRVRGEWFNADAEQVMAAVADALADMGIGLDEITDRRIPPSVFSPADDALAERLAAWWCAYEEHLTVSMTPDRLQLLTEA